MLFAFDLLELDGVDYRPLPHGERKGRLARLVDRRHERSHRCPRRAGVRASLQDGP
jgi:ATP-dependent DNA ligase